MHDAQERGPWDIASKAADDASFQVNSKSVAETLVHENQRVILGRDVGSFAKMSQDLDLGRQMVERATRIPLAEGCAGQKKEDERTSKIHRGISIINFDFRFAG
jgi:hypothetical protein